MHHFNKDKLLQAAKDQVAMVRKRIHELLPQTQDKIKDMEASLHKLPDENRFAAERVIRTLQQKTQNLDALYPSPYFIKCMIQFDTEATDRIFYFSKFSLPEEHIYSWTAPAASLRFADPGKFGFTGGHGEQVTGTLLHKEQYLITNGNIVFMAAEDTHHPRELIYQEHFSKRKTEFTLPEIVEQMEAAQDKAIRTPPTSSLLISGPAGSGKTTLALHRIAYLLQAPDTAEKFSAEKTIVFVNDHATKTYFASLLPELGIMGVHITTFSDFVFQQLHLSGYTYSNSNDDIQLEHVYAFQKQQALVSTPSAYGGDIYKQLLHFYAPYLSPETIPLFKQQQARKQLDRIDLTLLLKTYIHTHQGLHTTETEYTQQKGGKVSRKTKKVPLHYSLILLDEVQNYLPSQINLLKTLRALTGSTIYVGDLAQQTKLFTVRQWEQAGEQFTESNTVTLQKVYRSTKQILEHIQSQGYAVHIPDEVRTGEKVIQHEYKTTAERDAYISKVIEHHPDVTVGILGPTAEMFAQLQTQYAENTKVKILSISEAQGVEFDVVILCDSKQLLQADLSMYPEDLKTQVHQINRDLVYVGLTRAMNELYMLDVV